MNNINLLELVNISKSFPGVKALDNISMSVSKGEIHGIVGENGAGKSTLVKILARIIKEDNGEILFNNNRLSLFGPVDIQELGIQFVFQDNIFFENLTIVENFFRRELTKRSWFINWNKLFLKYKTLLKEYGLDLDLDLKIRDISIEKKQFLEIIRAFTLNAELIILDEPTTSLSDRDTKILYELINNAKKNNISIIYISHKLKEIYDLVDRVTILRDGKHIETTKVENLEMNSMVNLMIGRKISDFYYKEKAEFGKELLKIQNLNVKNELHNINLIVRSGEIVGVYGMGGSGRTELADAIFGLKKIISGEIILKEKKVKIKNPNVAMNNNIGYVTEDRKSQGLYQELSVKDNIIISSLEKVTNFGIISNNKLDRIIRNSISKLKIITPSINQIVLNLSGGNQQKVILAKWLLLNPDLLILDEPTKGIDVGAKLEIYKIMANLVKHGIGIIFISSDLTEILNISDRLYTILEGRIVGEFSKSQYDEQIITKSCLGI